MYSPSQSGEARTDESLESPTFEEPLPYVSFSRLAFLVRMPFPMPRESAAHRLSGGEGNTVRTNPLEAGVSG